jgi:hypothetical protein
MGERQRGFLMATTRHTNAQRADVEKVARRRLAVDDEVTRDQVARLAGCNTALAAKVLSGLEAAGEAVRLPGRSPLRWSRPEAAAMHRAGGAR